MKHRRGWIAIATLLGLCGAARPIAACTLILGDNTNVIWTAHDEAVVFDRNHAVYRWDVEAGGFRQLFAAAEPPALLGLLAGSADGELLAYAFAGYDAGCEGIRPTISFFRATDGRTLRSFHGLRGYYAARFGPQRGNVVLVHARMGLRARPDEPRKIEAQELDSELRPAKQVPEPLVGEASADGRWLLRYDRAQDLEIRDLKTAQPRLIVGHGRGYFGFATFSDDARWLAYELHDSRHDSACPSLLTIRNTNDLEIAYRHRYCDTSLLGGDWLGARGLFATIGAIRDDDQSSRRGKRVTILDSATWSEVGRFETLRNSSSALSSSHDGTRLALVGDLDTSTSPARPIVYDVNDPSEARPLRARIAR